MNKLTEQALEWKLNHPDHEILLIQYNAAAREEEAGWFEDIFQSSIGGTRYELGIRVDCIVAHHDVLRPENAEYFNLVRCRLRPGGVMLFARD